ncbi:Por secretion system C-terminal sorting domain-containing protein [Catalinimonas alkaloidigena]|uniref:Por secretion system C-terminal sorting domain-containing protein n=1 Tax=Catalinimonas alkaloidigena TaxID=1075417 RepID=A0A1G9QIJ6_9BACT|nr:T9SS type A sorting domain-containing protein [Catalinimonas alkaloidigena]SDM10823.1 Por secretion system C-terminal sorting domain-containing protein [Catalinimonas alkaloidigena]
MKTYALFLFLLLALSWSCRAAEESEPNDAATQADPVAANETMAGLIGYANGGTTDAADWFTSLVPDDGTLRLVFEAQNTSGNAGADFFVQIFNSKNGNLLSQTYANTPVGQTERDTLYVYGLAKDSIFVKITSAYSYSYSFHYHLLPAAANDREPNDLVENAQVVPSDGSAAGRISYANGDTQDPADWFATMLADDGTLRLIFEAENTSHNAGADFFVQILNSKRANLLSQTYANTPIDGTVRDTLYVYGLAHDTVFFKITSAYSYDYSFAYTLLPAAASDTEPNNETAEAQSIAATEPTTGRISYTNGDTQDPADWFTSLLPDDGTLRMIFEAKNTSHNAGADFFVQILNSKSGNLLSQTYANTPIDGTVRDTLYVYGLAQEAVYFKITSAYTYDYTFHYALLPAHTPDREPNDERALAQKITANDTVHGRISYQNGDVFDGADWFGSLLPDFGTVEVVLEARNTSHNAGADFFFQILSSNNTNLLNKTYANTPIDGTVRDTLYVNGLAKDSLFFKVTSAYSYDYTFTYRMYSPTSARPGPVAARLFTVYPNPSGGQMTLAPTITASRVFVQVIDAYGRTVAAQTLDHTTPSTNIPLDLTMEHPGLYFVCLTTATGQTYTQRIVLHPTLP